jgi:hypothetical protein
MRTPPLPLRQRGDRTPETTFTQELQLISRTGSGVEWIAGMFYFNDKAGFDPIQLPLVRVRAAALR